MFPVSAGNFLQSTKIFSQLGVKWLVSFSILIELEQPKPQLAYYVPTVPY